MSPEPRRRYPGAASFGTDDDGIFFGRSREITQLRALVLAERLTIIYARSGMGKSSLINAGLKNWLWTQSIAPVPVRFNFPGVGTLGAIYEGVQVLSASGKVEVVVGEKTSLWQYFKTLQIWRDNVLLTPLLIFDQFEELFTLQTVEQRALFIGAFGDLVRGFLRESDPQRHPDGRVGDLEAADSQLQAPPDIRVLLSLREDFLGELEELSEAIPRFCGTASG